MALTRTSCPEAPYSRRSMPVFSGDPSMGEWKLGDMDTEGTGTEITRRGEKGEKGEEFGEIDWGDDLVGV